MAWATEPLNVVTDEITVRTIDRRDIDEIAEAIFDPTGWSGRIWGMHSTETIRQMLNRYLEDWEKGLCNPFVYLVEGQVAGISRFHSLFPERRALEIGGTCVVPNRRRTFVNTTVKSILMAHAFENLKAVRVELRVDCSNYVSQMNVLRLGAKFEGVIRNWQIRKNGDVPDGMLYSVTDKDWVSVKPRLIELQQGRRPKPDFLPEEAQTQDLRLRTLKLSDADCLLQLSKRNKSDLLKSFRQLANLQSLDQAHAYIAEGAHLAASRTAFRYGLWLKESNRFIGLFQIKNIEYESMSAELKHHIDSEFKDRGLISQCNEFAAQKFSTLIEL